MQHRLSGKLSHRSYARMGMRRLGPAFRRDRRFGGLLCCMVALSLGGCGSAGTNAQSAATSSATAPATSSTAAKGSSTGATTASTNPTSTASAAQPETVMTVASSIDLMSLPKRYTCDGANAPLPLKWKSVPPGTHELQVLVVNAKDLSNGRLFADWGVAGLSPRLRGLSPGNVPAGAIVGRNSFGQDRYSICPRRGASTAYVAFVFALPQPAHLRPGFSVSARAEKLLHTHVGEGTLEFLYKRP